MMNPPTAPALLASLVRNDAALRDAVELARAEERMEDAGKLQHQRDALYAVALNMQEDFGTAA